MNQRFARMNDINKYKHTVNIAEKFFKYEIDKYLRLQKSFPGYFYVFSDVTNRQKFLNQNNSLRNHDLFGQKLSRTRGTLNKYEKTNLMFQVDEEQWNDSIKQKTTIFNDLIANYHKQGFEITKYQVGNEIDIMLVKLVDTNTNASKTSTFWKGELIKNFHDWLQTVENEFKTRIDKFECLPLPIYIASFRKEYTVFVTDDLHYMFIELNEWLMVNFDIELTLPFVFEKLFFEFEPIKHMKCNNCTGDAELLDKVKAVIAKLSEKMLIEKS